MLYIFGGLPGTGKSTLAQQLAQDRHAVYLRIDTIEQALRDCGAAFTGPEGYAIAYQLAADNLGRGLSVVADSVNPLQLTRAAWREVAQRAGVPFVEIEILCSNPSEHRTRVETRSTDIRGLVLPTWDKVVQRNYEPWDTPHIVIDTAQQSIAQSIVALAHALM